MLVTIDNFQMAYECIDTWRDIALDTETSGLRPYHGDRLFSIIMADRAHKFYFNFLICEGVDYKKMLTDVHLRTLQRLFDDPRKTWIMHNAKFDMAMLANESLYIKGTVHDTKAIARVLRNDHWDYSLDACAKRIGYEKDDKVKKYILDNNLWDWESRPGKKTRTKRMHYDRVPLDIIQPYAEQDAKITSEVACDQYEQIFGLGLKREDKLGLLNLMDNENKLTKTVFNMEQRGILIDVPYCKKAAEYELKRSEAATREFKLATGKDFKASSKLFEEIFLSEKDKWEYTEPTKTCPEGNPSFDSDTLKLFDNPMAKLILEYRDAKSKSDFYLGFIYHSDRNGVVHPNFNSDGTATGRFSSSDPNFQNLTSEEDEETLAQEFVIRRAIIPRPGYVFYMPDFEQMEYKVALELACRLQDRISPLAERVAKGEDYHQAVTDMVTQMTGKDLGRKKVKNANFAKLYGAGYSKLSLMLKCTYEEAAKISKSIDKVAPEVIALMNKVDQTAKTRGYVFNWMGRRCYFPDKSFSYKALNYLVQGGCADIVKVAMNRIDEALGDKKSKMLMTIHDEFLCEIHESEINEVPKIIDEIITHCFDWKYVPITASAEWSPINMADKRKGHPCLN